MADQLCTIIGNVGRTPDLRFTGSGQGLASFSVACERRWKPKDSDKWEGVTTWYNVTAWGELGEHVAASVNKGDRVIMTGTVELRNYETADGEKRTSLEFRPDEIGVSLKNATVEVQRIVREKGGEVVDSTPKSQRQAEPVYGEDEPFAMIDERRDLTYRDMSAWL